MGYCMHQGDSKFRVAAQNRIHVRDAIRTLAQYAGEARHGHYAWVNTADLVQARTDIEALEAWRWDVRLDAQDNIIGIEFQGEKLGDDIVMFNVIAPFVERGSYIVMHGEDGETWRWYFDGVTCKEQSAQVSFGNDDSGEVIEGEAAQVVPFPQLT